MMDKNSIKDTGILEQYLLGELSEDQRIEVETLLKENQEVREYFFKIEEDFEKLALENAISPPAYLKNSLLNSIAEASQTKNNPEIVKLNPKTQRSIYLAIAASLAFLFMLSSGWLYNKWQSSENNLQVVTKETLDLRNRVVLLEENLKETNTWYSAINNPNTIQLVLKGNQLSPTSTAITYVNHNDKTVILNPKGLAKLDENKTYQMWADVDGEMINMGIIPSDKEMIAMKYIDDAESINITIEPAGGNDHPTVEQLISNVLL